MRKLLIMLITSVLALSVLVSCGENKKVVNKAEAEGTKIADEKKAINDPVAAKNVVDEKKGINDPVTTKDTTDGKKNVNVFVTIKEVVNKEGVSPNGEKVKYIYEVPIININKPKVQKINDMFLSLEKDQEKSIGNSQNMTLSIKSKAYLNDGIISAVMEIKRPGPGGIYAVNYDIENDKEISTKELLEKYKFDPKKLIDEINRQTKTDNSKPKEVQYYRGALIDLFVDTVITNIYPPYDYLKKSEEMQNKAKDEKEKYVIENIDKIKAYINNDGKFVFIHSGPMEDEELDVEIG